MEGWLRLGEGEQERSMYAVLADTQLTCRDLAADAPGSGTDGPTPPSTWSVSLGSGRTAVLPGAAGVIHLYVGASVHAVRGLDQEDTRVWFNALAAAADPSRSFLPPVSARAEDALLSMVTHGCFEALGEGLREAAHARTLPCMGPALLALACARGHLQCLDALLSAGVPANAAVDGRTALAVAAAEGRWVCVRALAAAGADLEIVDEDGSTALAFAAESGHTPCVRALIELGASVDHASQAELTPLARACARGHEGSVGALLAAGADVSRVDETGHAPLHHAARHGHAACVRRLLAAGAEPNATPADGTTALMLACVGGHEAACAELIEGGADVDAAPSTAVTALIAACVREQLSCAELLLRRGAAIDKALDGAGTVLHWACLKARLRVVQLLSSYGAARTFEDGSTAEGIAASAGPRAEGVLRFLERSRHWTSTLHHAEFISAARARELLVHGCADPHERAPGVRDAPSPVDVARALREAGAAPPGSAAHLVLEAAEPWSPSNHHTFPPHARARAAELLRLGCELAHEPRFDSVAQAVRDVWVEHVLPHAVTRAAHERAPPLSVLAP